VVGDFHWTTISGARFAEMFHLTFHQPFIAEFSSFELFRTKTQNALCNWWGCSAVI